MAIMFYIAVHLVEREFAKIDYHPKGHKDREEVMSSGNNKTFNILKEYNR